MRVVCIATMRNTDGGVECAVHAPAPSVMENGVEHIMKSRIASVWVPSRRALIAVPLAIPAKAQESLTEVLGTRLVLNGTGLRRFFGVPVFRAWLYLVARERDATRILFSSSTKMLRLRYLRDIERDDIEETWDEAFKDHCRCAVPADFRVRFRDVREGEVETWLFTSAGAEVRYGEERPARVGSDEAPRLLAYFIGPNSPSEGLRRGLLGIA